MIRVLIAEDHGVVRAGLMQLLINAPDMEVVGAASGGREAVELATSTRPDVVLMDLSMPDLDGVAATRAIRDTLPGARVVILTSFSDAPRILNALDAGAAGYLLKDSDPDELYRAIRAAARGESPLAPKAASVVIAARADRSPRASDLSERERDVLGLLAQGHPNKVIGRTLGIAEKTVKSHVTRILKALEASDRTQAALWAQRQGLV
jgi:DNA-binding NarL/FixJ family response regulator